MAKVYTGLLRFRLQVLVEPGNHPLHDVAPVVGLANGVTLPGIDDELGGNSEGF
jgi:hypothetical protein